MALRRGFARAAAGLAFSLAASFTQADSPPQGAGQSQDAALKRWRENYHDLCLTSGLTARTATPATQELEAVLASVAADPDMGAHTVETLRGMNTAVCLADDLGRNHGFYSDTNNILYINSLRHRDHKVLIAVHETRHTHQKKHGILAEINMPMPEAIRLTYAAEADAMAVTSLFAWTMKERGEPKYWTLLNQEQGYTDIPAAFADSMRVHKDPVRATYDAFLQWYESEFRRQGYAQAVTGTYAATREERKAMPYVERLPANYFDRLCDLSGGRNYKGHKSREVSLSPG